MYLHLLLLNHYHLNQLHHHVLFHLVGLIRGAVVMAVAVVKVIHLHKILLSLKRMVFS